MVMLHGNCLEIMQQFEDNTFDAVVTDPPYGLKFMSKEWDNGIPGVSYWGECLRVCKPGAYLISFGGTRTYHTLACNIENSGWEIRDCLMWLYSSGFPKNKSSLKPAYEPILLARKPIPSTVINNKIEFGTGELNINSCRIGTDIIDTTKADPTRFKKFKEQDGNVRKTFNAQGKISIGRYPSNLICDEYVNLNGKPRFYYCAKPSKIEKGENNNHISVKPKELMKWLITLITPVGGKIIDPFAGSGSTVISGNELGYDVTGIEINQDYYDIACSRLKENCNSHLSDYTYNKPVCIEW